jgi:DNA-binding response OmpR family regulator
MSEAAAYVAIVEDDRDIADILQSALSKNGFETACFQSGSAFLQSLAKRAPDLCLIDLTLPDRDGLSIVAELRAHPGTASIIVSGRRELDTKLIGLELGADDYIVKPFEDKEIVARVRSVLRRMGNAADRDKKRRVARFSGWTTDFGVFELISPAGERTSLSGGEARVLQIFLEAANRLLTRADLMDKLGIDSDANFDRSIDVRISRLRAKLEKDPRNPRFIKTVYGAGYLMAAQVEWS